MLSILMQLCSLNEKENAELANEKLYEMNVCGKKLYPRNHIELVISMYL